MGAVCEDSVGEPQSVAFIDIGQHDVDGQSFIPCMRAVNLNRDGVEQHCRCQLRDDIGGGSFGGGAELAITQFCGTGEIPVAPGTVFGTVAELFVGVGQQRFGSGMARFREYNVIEYLCDRTVIAGVERITRFGDDRVGATHEFDVPNGLLNRSVFPQTRRVAVEPAEVALIDRFDVYG